MKFVAFLRGINIVGKNKIEMKRLREIFAALGFENVRTYINSGNVIFETRKTDDKKLAEKIESAIEKKFAMDIKTMVRSIAEIEEIVKFNPFGGEFENEKDVHVLFLSEEMPEEKRELLVSHNNPNERFVVRGREVFHHTKIGFVDSLLGKDYIGKKLKVSATARNWRTVNKILEI